MSLHLPIDKIDFEQVLNFLPHPFVISEFNGGDYRNHYANKKFVEEIGYETHEIPDFESWFTRAYPDINYRTEILTKWQQEMEKVFAKEQDSATVDALIHTKYNGPKWFQVKATVHGDIHLIAFINIDDTVTNTNRLNQLSENQNRILSILSHDLRGPISNLFGISSLAIQSGLNQDDLMPYFKTLNTHVFQVIELMDTTMVWAQENFKNLTPKIEEVHLPQVIKGILTLYETSYRSKGIAVDVSPFKRPVLNCDEKIITIIIRNILSNAIKFTPEGGHIQIRESFNENHQPVLIISDTGVGMDESLIESIRAGNPTARRGTNNEKGLGIALRLCQELATKTNVSLEFAGKEEGGTEVLIVFN